MAKDGSKLALYQVDIQRTETQFIYIMAESPEAATELVILGNGDGSRPQMSDWKVTSCIKKVY